MSIGRRRPPVKEESIESRNYGLGVRLMRVFVSAEEASRLEKTADAMGSTFSVILYGQNPLRMEAAIDTALGEAQRLDALLSNYRPDSEWSKVNRCAGEHPVEISTELFQLLSASLKYSLDSDGAFDISVGPLLNAWGIFRGESRIPSPAELAAARALVDFRQIRLEASNRTVQFAHPGMEMCPGGIGKGFAIDRMVDILRNEGFDTALVMGAGSSIYGLGTPPSHAQGWPIDIQDPRNPRKAVAEVFLKNMSLSTSGTYEKAFWAGGQLYSHVIDPRSGLPAQGVTSVSVIAPLAMDSEAWTKPCLLNGPQWITDHIPANFRVFFCEDIPGRECSWLC